MKLYKTFEVCYWPKFVEPKTGKEHSAIFAIGTIWEDRYHYSYVDISIDELEESLEESLEKPYNAEKTGYIYKAIIDQVKKECPDISNEERFLLLIDW